MSLTKMVNGTSVDLTPEEEVEVRAEWKKNEGAPDPLVFYKPGHEALQLLVAKGILKPSDLN